MIRVSKNKPVFPTKEGHWRAECSDREGVLQDILEATTLHNILQMIRDYVNVDGGEIVKISLRWFDKR